MEDDCLTKLHIIVFCVILEALEEGGLTASFLRTLKGFDIEPTTLMKWKIAMSVQQSPKWGTRDVELLTCIVSYIVHRGVIRREEMDKCLAELEKRMKKEKEEGIMPKKDYLMFRKANFEVGRIIRRLDALPYPATYNFGFYDWDKGNENIFIHYNIDAVRTKQQKREAV